MLVEILSVSIKKGIVEIQALDVSEENLARMERMRDDMNNPEITFLLDTREEKVLTYLNNWLHRQKAVRKQECTTWGQALQAVVGTITTISGKPSVYFSVFMRNRCWAFFVGRFCCGRRLFGRLRGRFFGSGRECFFFGSISFPPKHPQPLFLPQRGALACYGFRKNLQKVFPDLRRFQPSQYP